VKYVLYFIGTTVFEAPNIFYLYLTHRQVFRPR
jgi:hypothetical protein